MIKSRILQAVPIQTIAIAVLLLLASVFSGSAARAADQEVELRQPASTAGTPASNAAPSSTGFSLERLPKRLIVFVVSSAVGAPIALARCTARELVNRTKECYSLGGVPAPIGYMTAAAFGIPSGVLSGAWFGASDSIADSWVYSTDARVTRDTLSLGKLVF